MSWKDILKQQIASPEEVEAQMDSGSLSDACCGQAKNQLMSFLAERPNKKNRKVENFVENNSCAEVKQWFQKTITRHENEQRKTRPQLSSSLIALKQIIEDWENCDGGN